MDPLDQLQSIESDLESAKAQLAQLDWQKSQLSGDKQEIIKLASELGIAPNIPTVEAFIAENKDQLQKVISSITAL